MATVDASAEVPREGGAARGRKAGGVSDPTPFYRSDDGAVEVYHDRWENVYAAGLAPREEIALIHADPSYGIGYRTLGAIDKRGGIKPAFDRSGKERGTPQPRDFEPLAGDDKPHDPSSLLALDRPTVSWGANHYASRLPDQSAWLSWDKRGDTGSDDGSDVELAWSNLGGTARRFVHLWRGTCRASETGRAHLWAAQKPEALSAWVFAIARERRVKLTSGALLFVPYMGSFPDYRPARALGLRVVACDVSRAACEIACAARLRAVPVQVESAPVRQLGFPGGVL
jgi:hypothetical protein